MYISMDTIESIKKLPYEENVNYAELVISFAKDNKMFLGNPEYFIDTSRTVKHINSLTEKELKGINRNIVWYNWHKGQLFAKERIRLDKLAVLRHLAPPTDSYVFLTVGFDDTTDIDYPKMQHFADKILHLNGSKFVMNADYVLEKHRSNRQGDIYCHHHIHFLIIPDEKLSRSKITELIMKIGGIRRYVKEKNFIDIKTPNHSDLSKRAQPYATLYNYVKGIKTSEKAVCLQSDKAWREQYPTHVHFPTYEKCQS